MTLTGRARATYLEDDGLFDPAIENAFHFSPLAVIQKRNSRV